jgi:hypothetical protein
MEKENKSDVVTLIFCVALVVVSLISSFAYYNIVRENNMSKNIESAISRGVDPISVKCTYESVPSATCITYALRGK